MCIHVFDGSFVDWRSLRSSSVITSVISSMISSMIASMITSTCASSSASSKSSVLSGVFVTHWAWTSTSHLSSPSHLSFSSTSHLSPSHMSAASTASHSSSSSHWSPLEVRTVKIIGWRTSHRMRWVHWALSHWSTSISHLRVWSFSSVHHSMRRTHWLLSHHWPFGLEVALEASLVVSSGRRVLVVWLTATSP